MKQLEFIDIYLKKVCHIESKNLTMDRKMLIGLINGTMNAYNEYRYSIKSNVINEDSD